MDCATCKKCKWGFISNGLLVFQSKKTGDYNEKMNSARFEKWFSEQLLPIIVPNSVIIMDNASYHSVKAEKVKEYIQLLIIIYSLLQLYI